MPPLFASGGHAFCPLLTRGSGPAPCFSLRRLTGATGLPTERRRHRDALASLPSSSSAPRRAAAVSHSAGQLLLGSTEGSGRARVSAPAARTAARPSSHDSREAATLTAARPRAQRNPYVPREPDVVYADRGWEGWDDFLNGEIESLSDIMRPGYKRGR